MAAAVTLVAGIAQAGFDAGQLVCTNLSNGSVVTNSQSSSIVDVTQFIGPVDLMVVVPANGGSNTASVITPTLHTGMFNNASSNFTGTVSGTTLAPVTNGPTTFFVKIEQGTFTQRYARIDYVPSETNVLTNAKWAPVAYIIGHPRNR